jgi:outer membrane immunogenic protein
VDPKWLVGVEADIQGAGERSSTGLTTATSRYGSEFVGLPVGLGADFNAISTLATSLSYDLQWFATFRGRVGFLATPQTLLYGTGGLAVGEFGYSATSNLSVAGFGPGLAGTTPTGVAFTLPVGPAATSSDTRVGWTLGAGIEHKFTPNWSGKLEYLYMDFGTKTYFAGTANQADVSFRDQILRAGINYEFAAAPVTARY